MSGQAKPTSGPLWMVSFTQRTRCRVGPNRHRVRCGWSALHNGPDVGLGQTDIGSVVDGQLYTTAPMSGWAKPTSGPLLIVSFTQRVRCRPMCIRCRIRCCESALHTGSDVGRCVSDVGSDVDSQLCTTAPMSGWAKPTSGPLLIVSFAQRVRCRPMCIRCRIRC